jgi:hypothetical protein
MALSLFYVIIHLICSKRSCDLTESAAASSFVEIENCSSGAGISSRSLEPLISLALSSNSDDHQASRKYTDKIVSLASHRAPRVQFMALWAMASMTLKDEISRVQLHNDGGSKLIMDRYEVMSPIVQLEALAALANMSLSDIVSEALVRQYNCIPFLMKLINGHKPRHGLFALICLCNLTRREVFREQIRLSQGIQTLVSCLMSHDYHKRKFGALALSNMALSVSEDIDNIFKTRGLIDRVVKMASRREHETQREVVALVRNLACHSRLRSVLVNSNILTLIEDLRCTDLLDGVGLWVDEISNLIKLALAQGDLDDYKGGGSEIGKKSKATKDDKVSEDDMMHMRSMKPLSAAVEWSTWGSKLDTMYAPLVDNIPCITETMTCDTSDGDRILINLSVCLPTSTYVQWRNDARYCLLTIPKKGILTQQSTPTIQKNKNIKNNKIKTKLGAMAVDDDDDDDDKEEIEEEIAYTKPHVLITDTDSLIYTPNDKSIVGNDKFAFVVLLGGVVTRQCVITIKLDGNTIGDDDDNNNDKDIESGGSCGRSCFTKLNPLNLKLFAKKNKKDDYDEDEYNSI